MFVNANSFRLESLVFYGKMALVEVATNPCVVKVTINLSFFSFLLENSYLSFV